MFTYILYTIMYRAQNKTLYKKERSYVQDFPGGAVV